jgi:hypothetical protein
MQMALVELVEPDAGDLNAPKIENFPDYGLMEWLGSGVDAMYFKLIQNGLEVHYEMTRVGSWRRARRIRLMD